MKITTYRIATPDGPQERVGVVSRYRVWDATAVTALAKEAKYTSGRAHAIAQVEAPPDLVSLVSEEGAIERLATAQSDAEASGRSHTGGGAPVSHALEDVELMAPVPQPPGIACFTVWPSHIADSIAKGFNLGVRADDSDIRGYYKATPDTVAGPGHAVVWPWYTEAFDVECEIAAVVGRSVKDVTPEQADQAILGYMIFNDFSAREIQREEMALGLGPTKGKDMDGGNVFGPYITTADAVGDVRSLTMSLHVNGEKWSSCKTEIMDATFGELLSYLARGHTVRSGQILTSGCYPGGSGLDLGREIHVGDEVELRISKLGSLRNTIVGGPGIAHEERAEGIERKSRT